MASENIYCYDIETFKNCFSLVAKRKSDGRFFQFVILEDDQLNQAEELFQFLWTKPDLVGYNNNGFDAQVVEEIWNEKLCNGRDIYNYAQQVIETKDPFNLKYKPWNFTFKQLDLMAINNYGIYGGRPTSLKWLEFSTRQQTIKDMPKNHWEELTVDDIDDLLKYNQLDVNMTEMFYDLCDKQIGMRNVLAKLYKDELIMNQPNSSIGEKIVLNTYCDYSGKDKNKIKKTFSKRKLIDVKDIILPYIGFKNPLFIEVKKDFEKLKLKADSSGVIKLKGVYEKEIEFQDMTIKYALGGIHGCVKPGIYKPKEGYILKTCDVTSMYPNIAIANNFYPEHLGPVFVKAFQAVLNERKKYPKDTDPEMNAAYKEGANSVNN